MNKLTIISIVMYVLKQSSIVGCGLFCKLKLIYLKHLVYGICHAMEWCRGRQKQVNKIKIQRLFQKHELSVQDQMVMSGVYKKLIIISIVIYVLKLSSIRGGSQFLQSETNLFKTPRIQYRSHYGVVQRLAATGK